MHALKHFLHLGASILFIAVSPVRALAADPLPDKAAALAAVKGLIAKVAGSQTKVRVWVNFLGKTVQAPLEEADDKGFVVRHEGNLFPTKWDRMSEPELAVLLKSILQDDPHRALVATDYALATGQWEKADAFLTVAAAQPEELQGQLTARINALHALRTAARSAAQAPPPAGPLATNDGRASSVTIPAAKPPVNPYDPTAGIDFSQHDPSIDPGIDPVFLTDPRLNKNEDYTYVFTKPGDHVFPEKTFSVPYDVKGAASLDQVLTAVRDGISGSKALAIYLVNGTELKYPDVKTAQSFNKPVKDGGLGLSSVVRLYIYNLRSLEGGVQTTEATLNGAFMWANGWQTCTLQHLHLDDLEEVKDGTFCNYRFLTISLKGARTVGVMAFGGPHAGGPTLTDLYLPSVTHIKEHAFRRNKRLLRVNLPKVVSIESYGFDDCDAMQYFNAPELKTLGRNTFNDTGRLISVNMPKLESLRHACFGINDAMRILRLPSCTTIVGDGFAHMHHLELAYLPQLKKVASGGFAFCGKLAALHIPKAEVLEKDSFIGDTALKRVELPSAVRVDPEAFAGVEGIDLIIKGKKKARP